MDFTDLCRKDCPWLSLRDVTVKEAFEDGGWTVCKNFQEMLNTGVEKEVYKCDMCKEVTKVESNQFSIDALVHITSILRYNISVLTADFQVTKNEMEMLKVQLAGFTDGMRKAQLRELIKNDPQARG